MITDYLGVAMNQARYEKLSENEGFYGEIPACNGVFACGETLEQCREELAAVLEDWILFRIHQHLELPVIEGVQLKVVKEAAA